MTPAQAAELLAVAAAFDRRTVGELEAKAWAKALHGMNPKDCADAIAAHYGRSSEWLMPAHIRAEVRRVRDERIRADMTDPEYPADDVRGGLDAIRARRRALGDGAPPVNIPVNPIQAEQVVHMVQRTLGQIESRRGLRPGAV